MRRLAFVFALCSATFGATLSPATLRDFDAYMKSVDAQMAQNPPLWVTKDAERQRSARDGEIPSGYAQGTEPREVTDGLIHDWFGAVFLPGAQRQQVVRILTAHDRHAAIYAPEVLSARLTGESNGVQRTTLRLRKKKVITVVLEADFEVRVSEPAAGRTLIGIRSTRIAEVEDPGEKDERVKLPDTGHGFLWRLHSWYTVEQVSGGVWVELRSVSLTRDVPFGLGRVIGPMVYSLPKESLEFTLERTRAAVQAKR
jgi:hypothetical protein